jgi:hypothetical protein
MRLSVWRLAQDLHTYPDLIAGLCRFYDIPMALRGRARTIDADDAERVAHLLWVYKGRMKISAYTRPKRRRKRG